MSSSDPSIHAADRYESLGLIGDPFLLPDERQPEATGVRVLTRTESLRLLAAVEASAAETRSTPVLVFKNPGIPAMYNTMAEADMLRECADQVGVLPVYVPLDLMSIGKIRGALAPLAEHLAEDTFDLTLAAYVRSVLAEPDTTMPEFSAVADQDFAALAQRFADEPSVTLAEYFGECVDERAGEDIELMMRVSVERQSRLEAEPTEADASPEEDSGDSELATVFTAPIASEDEGVDAGSDEVDEVALSRDLMVDYLIAHTRAHLSPVIARGLMAYAARGMSSMSQEFKITKAPRKTLRALMRFATYRYRKVALLYDRLEQWDRMDDDYRARVAGTFTELRMAGGEHGILVISTTEGAAPELEELFSGARSLRWDFQSLAKLMDHGASFDDDMLREWLSAAACFGKSESGDAVAAALQPLREGSGGMLDAFVPAACAAIESAAERGATTIDTEALAAGHAALAEG